MSRLKLIVSAYGCEPNKGSESGTGWFWIECMARHFELWVITKSNNEENIVNNIPDEIKENVHFVYYDLPQWLAKHKKREKGFYWYYFLWQKRIVKIAKQLVKDVRPDYIMHLTFGSVWLPTYMHKLKCPFIWGPVGGGEAIPDCYLSDFGIKERVVQKSRKLLIKFSGLNLSHISRCKKAELIIVRTKDTLSTLPRKYRDKAVVMLETAISNEVIAKLETIPEDTKFKEKITIVYSGRLIPLKAVDIAISAIHKMRNRSHVEFIIIGKGFLRKELEQKARLLGIEQQIKFVGELSREQVLNMLKGADIFLFPSLKEGGTWALMEAMAAGLPCVCIDTSGMHIITDDKCAIRIKPQLREQTAVQMAGALDYLVENPSKAAEMGRMARERIKEHFTWSAKEKFIVAQIKGLEKNESINAESE